MKTKQYYLDLIEKVYNQTLERYIADGKDEDCFDFGVEIDNYNDVDEEMVVGYYLKEYGDKALGVWLENKSYSDTDYPTDNGVHDILEDLFQHLFK